MRDGHDDIAPVVLVGGRSSRFGRDKLRESMADGSWLVDRPIAALRAVFGPRVALVGACDAAVAARGDRIVEDRHPGIGPAGGILSALESTGDICVLPGDLPNVDDHVVRAVLATALAHPDAWAALARSDRVEPCVGIYRRGAIGALREFVARREGPLGGALPRDRVALVDVDPRAVHNANTPADLEASR
ncbi:MAG: molybdenum cofactor guanylyltransferase [Phycisphaerales bacterium]